ncbi:protein kinase-like protein [Xylariomycetidae sp. FL2044]|nr:protein kinase-like protein [Xylariomycetidae sp. FL2044]
MELIPYTSREGREIVLRHRNALVVRDPTSQRLEIRGAALTECPTCHQPLRRSSSPERHFDPPTQHDESYVNPEYFRMLQTGHAADHPQPPSSPIRRLIRPTLPSGPGDSDASPSRPPAVPGVGEAEFISSAPAPQEGARIRREAFSPNYFQRFFVEERELGRGGKGVVLLVRHEIDGCFLGHFACKRVPVGDDHAWLEKVLIEVELLAKLSHPNLVSYRHVWLEDVQLHRFGPSVACAFILQQYCNHGDLLQYIIGDRPKETTKEQLKAQMRRRSKATSERPHDLFASQRRLSFEEIYSLFKDITSGLAYLHHANYVHRDLKPSNCLLHHENGKLTCLISDFGEVQPGNAVRQSTGTTGTISYCAPEVLRLDVNGRYGNFTTKSDVFSLGMILYFLCFGGLPYLNANTVEEELEDIDLLRAEIADWKGFQDERRERPDLPAKLYQLLKQMLALDPAQRPGATEVLSVMNHQSNHGGLRGPRSTSPPIGLRTQRIQNLDSPMPPSTPISEPVKRPRGGVSSEDFGSLDDASSPVSLDSPQPTAQNIVQKYPGPESPRRRSHAMMISRSQDTLVRTSPERALARRASRSPEARATPTPLLMAPPAGRFEVLWQRARVAQHHLTHYIRTHTESIVFVFRFLLFLIKMASIARVCWPFMISLGVGVPLIGVAGMDLGLPPRTQAFAIRNEGDALRQVTTNASRMTRGWHFSSALLLLHFLTLWIVSRWGVLCAMSQNVDWADW